MNATPTNSGEPDTARSLTRGIKSTGRLSITNHPRSSSDAETVDRPAPDMPVTRRISFIASALLGQPERRRRMQVIVDRARQLLRDARRAGELRHAGEPDLVEGSKLLTQALS